MKARIAGENTVLNSERPEAVESVSVPVLLIQADHHRPVFTDEILRHAGFNVRAITPRQALTDAGHGSKTLAVVSNTLAARDVLELGVRLRKRNPKWKLLAILGSDSQTVDYAVFDRAVDGLEGPNVLIRAVRELASTLPGTPA